MRCHTLIQSLLFSGPGARDSPRQTVDSRSVDVRRRLDELKTRYSDGSRDLMGGMARSVHVQVEGVYDKFPGMAKNSGFEASNFGV